MKNLNLWIQEACLDKQDKLKVVTSGYNISKLQNMEVQGKILKAVRESGDHYKITTIRMRSGLFNNINGSQSQYNCTFIFRRQNNFQSRILCSVKLSFSNEGEMKSSMDTN